MLEAIRSAKRSINFETFVYWEGRIGEEFTEALAERARAGVPTHVVIDWLGSLRIDRAYVKRMKEAGVELNLYHHLPWYNPLRWEVVADVEDRTHRLILVVDGSIGFTGGAGIAHEWSGNAESPDHWREYGLRARHRPRRASAPIGVHRQLARDRGAASPRRRRATFRGFEPTRTSRAQAFKGSPHEATQDVELMYRLAIVSARESIKLESAYFVPDPGTIKALAEAAKRGVKVQIILPGEHLDSATVKASSPALWGDLLEAGVEIYRYQPTMLHCKVLIVDDVFASGGSTNFDNRSFQLNDEVNLNVFDEGFAGEQARIFADDLRRSKPYSYEEWKSRPWYQKTVNWITRPFWREFART